MEEIRWYEKLNYTETKDIIKEKLQNMSRDFVAIGFYLKLIRDKSLFLEDGYKSIWEFAEDNYGIKRSTASRWMAMNDRFSKNGNTPILSEEYISFGKSQLQEMLYLDDKQMEEVKPDMTAREIRGIRTLDPEPEEIEEWISEQVPGQMCVEDYPELLPEEEHSPEKCITGKSKSGICGAAAYCSENYSCCSECDQDCNSRCGWLDAVCDVAQDEIKENIPSDPVQKEDAKPELCEEISEKTDLDIAREENEKYKRYLEMAKEGFGSNDIRIRTYKVLVAALARYIHDLDMAMNPPKEPEQPELPIFRNNDQRKEWLRNYKDWGIWYTDEHIGCTYYKYDFENGARLIAEEYESQYTDYVSYLHLINGPKSPRGKYGQTKWTMYKQYNKYPNSESELVEFLKWIQKGAK